MLDVTSVTADEIAARLAPLLQRPEIALVVLFGSVARGEAHARSDIDLGILADEPLEPERWTEVARLLDTDRVDLVDLRRATPLLAMGVARGRPLYERDTTQFPAFCSLALRRYNDTEKLRRLARERIERYLVEHGHR